MCLECIKRLLRRRSAATTKRTDERVPDMEAGGGGFDSDGGTEGWGDWDESGVDLKATTPLVGDSSTQECPSALPAEPGAMEPTDITNNEPQISHKPKSPPTVAVRRRTQKKQDFFAELGMVPTYKAPKTQSRTLHLPKPGTNSRFATDQSAEDAASGWDMDTVSDTSGWVEDGVFAGVDDVLDLVDLGEDLKKD